VSGVTAASAVAAWIATADCSGARTR
jgi:hypothetical protein